ncbi:hypothetical protein GRI39_01860 [Altererythrobacter indicus]|uniref:Uncharacterized protein n=1 Tax=Altericroceibacterium indicum TaxID=374177 RepID=A0A845A6X7_9SPHN|nr:hypothetical protein [Altericroceibacterium indicum]MXP24791.1 hypothetical protein [Altericroceibacterium indicum]
MQDYMIQNSGRTDADELVYNVKALAEDIAKAMTAAHVCVAPFYDEPDAQLSDPYCIKMRGEWEVSVRVKSLAADQSVQVMIYSHYERARELFLCSPATAMPAFTCSIELGPEAIAAYLDAHFLAEAEKIVALIDEQLAIEATEVRSFKDLINDIKDSYPRVKFDEAKISEPWVPVSCGSSSGRLKRDGTLYIDRMSLDSKAAKAFFALTAN